MLYKRDTRAVSGYSLAQFRTGSDFSRMRIPACDRQAASRPGAHRCEIDDDDCTRDEPVFNRTLKGEAVCNTATGVVDTLTFKEHCAGNCVSQHEYTHGLDMALCCERFSLCMDKAPDLQGRNQCREQWENWWNNIDAWTECNAYNTEGQCLTQLIAAQCRGGNPNPTVSEDCCQSLQSELDFVTRQATKYCNNALVWPCPFTEDGKISPI